MKIVLFALPFVLLCLCAGAKTPSDMPDYATAFAWVSKPEPKNIDKPVDVFFVYPTIYVGEAPPNMDIADEELRANAGGLLIAQGGVYSPYANLFAPFYRQQTAATQSMEANNGGKDAFTDPLFITGYKDVARAFEYYLKHLNNGRPFILAGHSQGSMVIIQLLRDYLKDADLQKRMVAAYPIGYSVTKKDLKSYPWIKLAQGETDTGVVITFNTQAEDAGPSPVLLEGAVAINPLNWKTDGTPASRKGHKGAVFFDDATGEVIARIPHFAAAYVDTDSGALIATDTQENESDKVDFEHMGRWSKGVYHRFDYAIWYNNLKENVKKRIDAYLNKKEL